MSGDLIPMVPAKKTDQRLRGEQLLRDMAAANGGELGTDEADRLVLRHPPTPPKPHA